MELIFGKNGTGIEEMQGYFSHLPGAIDFEEMASDILMAQEDLETYTGKEVIAEALAHYHSDNYDSEHSGAGSETSGSGGTDLAVLDEVVKRMQMAVCLMAYREYALNNDATHTATGRVARMDKDSDQFTESLINRDDFALQRKAQKAIDRLLKYIDEQQIESWTGSDAYSQTRDLLLWNALAFDRFHPIEKSQRMFMLLLPMIRTAQEDYVAGVVGAEKMATLLSRVKANTIDGEGETASIRTLYDKAGSAIAYLALAAGYRELPVQLFPESMSRQFWNAGNGSAFVGLRDVIVDSLYKEGLRKLEVLGHYLVKTEAEEAKTTITDEEITTVSERMLATDKFARV